MALTDDELLDFDQTRLADYDPVKAERSLAEHGNAFRYQLVAARQIEQWADRADVRTVTNDERFTDGLVDALRDVAAHLRQGDYLPGSLLYEETVGSNWPDPAE
jgi:hypothetical protein